VSFYRKAVNFLVLIDRKDRLTAYYVTYKSWVKVWKANVNAQIS